MPTGITWASRHSRLIGASTTRGDRTRTPGAAVRPVSANSSTSGGQSAEVWFICSARSSSTTFTTKSPVCSALRTVSLRFRARGPDENATVGGSPQTPMKKLKGARLLTPSAPTVETHAIGRGTTQPIRSL